MATEVGVKAHDISMGRLLLGVSLGLSLGACGDDDEGTSTVGAQCQTVMQSFCDRAYRQCTQSPANFDVCVSAGKDACCANQCDRKAASPDSVIDGCSAKMKAVSCDALSDPSTVSSAVPSECRGVVRPASAEFGQPGVGLEAAMSAGITR